MELLLILYLLEARRRMFFHRRPPMPFRPMMMPPMGPRLVRRPHGFHHHGPRF